MIENNLTHRNLCNIAGKFLKSKGIVPFTKCNYVFIELERAGECPDAIGFAGCTVQLVEVKVSRQDFLSDKKKYWRKNPEYGLGQYRSYMCPENMISKSELPTNWGLIYVDNNCNTTIVKHPEKQISNSAEEMYLLLNIMRREGIKPKIYSYKKYKTDTDD